MLAGRVPLRGDTTVRTLAMQMLDDPAPLRETRPDLDISDDLEGIIMKALAKNREERHESTDAFLAAIEEVTSQTELDLPRLLEQERLSGAMESQQAYDTIPETDIPHVTPSQLEEAPRRKRGKLTDPAFLSKGTGGVAQLFDPLEASPSEEFAAQRRSKNLMFLAPMLLIVGGKYVLKI